MMASETLPLQLTSFVGRERDLRKVTRLLEDPACRLLTLLGPGGVGKTRLAHEVARGMDRQFDDGIVWVDLQAVEGVDMLATTMAGTFNLSLSGHGSARQQLFTFLKDKNALLVLDNLEQLASEAGLLSELLRQAPAVTSLVTSRVALHVEGEWLYPLPGLRFPVEDGQTVSSEEIKNSDAVQLFVERARRVRPAFSLQDEQEGVLRICRLVGGVPLALEIAASWTRNLSCESIAAEIEGNLRFLTSPLRNVSQRHRSMQAVFAHSWALLSEEEKTVFRRLAVFRGGLRREAGEVVAGATLQVLAGLVDKSLLWREPDGRYHIHKLLQQYAEKQLLTAGDEAGKTRERHTAYYLTFLTHHNQTMFGGQQQSAVKEMEAELENIRIAWERALERGMTHTLASAVEPLAMFFHIKSRYLEGARMFESALLHLHGDDESVQRARMLALCEGGWLAIRLGKFEEAQKLLEECEALYHHLGLAPLPGEGTDPLLGLSTLASIRGEYALAESLAQQALHTATRQGHLNNLQTANFQLASVAYARGQYEKARDRALAAYENCRESGDAWFQAYCLTELGRAQLALEDYGRARRHFDAAYELRAAFKDRQGMALALGGLGEVAVREGQPQEAQRLLQRSLTLYHEIGDRGGLAAAHQGLGRALAAQEHLESAQQQYDQALSIAAEIQFAPLLLSILADIGLFLVQSDRRETGSALCAFVQEQPAVEHRTRELLAKAIQAPSTTVVERRKRPFADLEAAVVAARQALAIGRGDVEGEKHQQTDSLLVEPLTERELEVLKLVAQGLTNRQIAEELTVVVGTVKAHNNSIYGKLGVRNRVQAVAKAREFNLLGGRD